jgi:hypothetical protein
MADRRVRSYREFARISSFKERFEYLALHGSVGHPTFAFERWLNQRFYTSAEWKRVRDEVIVRDNGCDLGIPGYEINERILIHHMNPMTVDDIVQHDERILNPDFLICTTHVTHNAIHYGTRGLVPRQMIVRTPGDTKLWGKG